MPSSVTESPLVIKNQKAYSLSYTTLNTATGFPDFLHNEYQGGYITTLIVVLPNNEYLISEFHHTVALGSITNQMEGATYIYSDNKFTPLNAKLDFQKGILDGTIPWPAKQGHNVSLVIHSAPSDIDEIGDAKDFEKIKKLPGFENATYNELSRIKNK